MITFTITVQLEFMFSIQFKHSKLRVNVVSQLANTKGVRDMGAGGGQLPP